MMNQYRLSLLRRNILTIAFLALTPSPVFAASSWIHVTPANVTQQRLAIAVTVKAAPQGWRYRVAVKPKSGPHDPVYRFLQPMDGWIDDGRTANSGNQLPCSVKTTRLADRAVVYSFTIPRTYQSRARLTFGYAGYDTGTQSMPSADGYWIVCSEFPSHSQAHNGIHHSTKQHAKPVH